MSHYDYIIIGGGAAGLLLADILGRDTFFSSKQILIIEKNAKTQNDRTWCFWEHGNGDFEPLLHRKWSTIKFAGQDLDLSTSILPYRYKMLRGKDFYSHFLSQMETYSNVSWIQDEVLEVDESQSKVNIKTQNGAYTADQVFGSIPDFKAVANQNKYPLLQQHFLGWFVKTKETVFQPEEATFMDFSIPQKGNTRFMYVLPFSETEALLEYTLFSETLLEKSEYENAIKDYIQHKLGGVGYEILEVEQGSIPMTCYPFHHKNSERIFHLGIAGGWAKPSTGFTFYNTHRNVKQLVATLKQGSSLKRFYRRDRFWFYDLLLLDILYEKNHLGGAIFESMFKKRKASLILKFLGNETSFWEDLKIISACPKKPFLRALLRRLF
ncbi:lycopene cyclase family protein [Flagellimonas flava]|uniref:Lycopene beta-cyclase n=1 Tax=Flagellimonas flava TaxID=570519 RepID=A0A1M5MGK0_9FLAO|nr:lycopene cyclase family protein [Allomuricauda flava]SHG75823.1 lycopene beta-cyclase [Allomuricauda flava]